MGGYYFLKVKGHPDTVNASIVISKMMFFLQKKCNLTTTVLNMAFVAFWKRRKASKLIKGAFWHPFVVKVAKICPFLTTLEVWKLCD